MATSYRVEALKVVRDEFPQVPFPFRREIGHAVVELQREQRPKRCKSLVGNLYQLPVHGWTIVYVIDDDAAKVTIVMLVEPP